MANPRASPIVLLVEDEWLISADMADGLERAGWEVLEANTGEGAIEQLRNGQDIDLVITDIRLSGYLTGWDVAEAAREIRPDFPVIYVSANPLNPSRKVEGSVFLSKPCRGSELAKVAQKLLGLARPSDDQGIT